MADPSRFRQSHTRSAGSAVAVSSLLADNGGQRGADMADFAQRKAWLEAWYVRGCERSGNSFCLWLYPFTHSIVLREGLGHVAEEVTQEVIILFIDREKQVGRGAEVSEAFWRTLITWRVKDEARKHRKGVEVQVEVLPEGAVDPRVEATLIDLQRAEHLGAALDTLSPDRRLYIGVHVHQVHPFLNASDVERMAARTGRAVDELTQELETLDAHASGELLPLLFHPEEFETKKGRQRCLDTFRKGRSRAAESLQKYLEEVS